MLRYLDDDGNEISQPAPEIQDLIEEEENLEFLKWAKSPDWATNEIKSSLYSYVRAGLIAARVRLYRLYEKGQDYCKNFREYCERKLGMSNWHVKRLIDAARVAIELIHAGFNVIPTNEAQARPLTKYCGEALIEFWEQVLNSAPPKRITAELVNRIVEGEPEKPSRRIKIDSDDWEVLRERAQEEGLTPQELLKRLIRGESCEPAEEESITIHPSQDKPKPDPVTRNQMQRWVEDVQQLLIEKVGFAEDPVADSS